MSKPSFTLHKSDTSFSPIPRSGLHPRLGRLSLAHGEVETPVFMPVGTLGAVRGLAAHEVAQLDVSILLGNTYHLILRPGLEVIKTHGGLHRFMGWERPILTDSGGFQVYSLSQFRKLSEEGATFKSPVDGRQIVLTPENVVEAQETLGSDVMMVLDECTPYPATLEVARASMERSMRWAERARRAHKRRELALFGIVQGGMHAELREVSARALVEMGFEGLAVGGLSVGEPKDEMMAALEATLPHLPAEKPRYVMGVGKPEDLVQCVARGVDMFDCVIPTRNGRNAMVYTDKGPKNLMNAEHRLSDSPIDEACDCPVCRRYSRGYLRHCFLAKEMLGPRLSSLHNIFYFINLMARMRSAISRGDFGDFYRQFLDTYPIR